MARTEPQINIRLPQDLKESVQEMASINKRSVNAEIVSVLLEAVRHHQSGNFSAPVFSNKTAEEVSEILESVKRIEKQIKDR